MGDKSIKKRFAESSSSEYQHSRNKQPESSGSQGSFYDSSYKSYNKIQQEIKNVEGDINLKKDEIEEKIKQLEIEILQTKKEIGELTKLEKELSVDIGRLTEEKKGLEEQFEQIKIYQLGLENKDITTNARCKDIQTVIGDLSKKIKEQESLKITVENRLGEINQKRKDLQEKLDLPKEQQVSGSLGKNARRKLQKEMRELDQEKKNLERKRSEIERLEEELSGSKKEEEDIKKEALKFDKEMESVKNFNKYAASGIMENFICIRQYLSDLVEIYQNTNNEYKEALAALLKDNNNIKRKMENFYEKLSDTNESYDNMERQANCLKQKHNKLQEKDQNIFETFVTIDKGYSYSKEFVVLDIKIDILGNYYKHIFADSKKTFLQLKDKYKNIQNIERNIIKEEKRYNSMLDDKENLSNACNEEFYIEHRKDLIAYYRLNLGAIKEYKKFEPNLYQTLTEKEANSQKKIKQEINKEFYSKYSNIQNNILQLFKSLENIDKMEIKNDLSEEQKKKLEDGFKTKRNELKIKICGSAMELLCLEDQHIEANLALKAINDRDINNLSQSIESQRKAYEEKLQKFQSEKFNLEQDIESYIEKIVPYLEQLIKDNEEQLESHEKAMQEVNKREEWQKQVDKLTSQANELTSQIDGHSQALLDLQEQLAKPQEDLASALQEKEQLEAQIESNKQELEKTKKQLIGVEKQLQQKLKERDQISDSLTKLIEKQDGQEHDLQKAKEERKACEEEGKEKIEKLSNELKGSSKQDQDQIAMPPLGNELAQANEELIQTCKQLGVGRKEVEAFLNQQDVPKANDDLKQAHQINLFDDVRCKEYWQRCKKERNDLLQKENEISGLENSLEEKKQLIKKYNNDLKNLEIDIESLMKSLQANESKLIISKSSLENYFTFFSNHKHHRQPISQEILSNLYDLHEEGKKENMKFDISLQDKIDEHATISDGLTKLREEVAQEKHNLEQYKIQVRTMKEEYKKLFEDFKSIVTKLHYGKQATNLNDQGCLYCVQGKYKKAEPLLKDALKIRKEHLGHDHLDTASSLYNLGGFYYVQGKYSEAEPLLKDALKIRKEHLGPNHLDTARTLDNLGILYYVQGNYELAEPFCKQALEIRKEHLKEHLGPNHLDTASSFYNLGCIYYMQDKYSDAEPLLKKALEIRKEHLGDDHPDIASLFNMLEYTYKVQGKYEQATKLSSQFSKPQHSGEQGELKEDVLPASVRDEPAKPEQIDEARQEKPLEKPAQGHVSGLSSQPSASHEISMPANEQHEAIIVSGTSKNSAEVENSAVGQSHDSTDDGPEVPVHAKEKHSKKEIDQITALEQGGKMEEGPFERIFDKKDGKEFIEILQKMQSNPQAYMHHQLMLDAYVHCQPDGLSRKEVNSMAYDLMASAKAMAEGAFSAYKQNKAISSHIVEQINESEKECKKISKELDLSNDKQGAYSRQKIWKLFTAIHKYQDRVSDLVDCVQKYEQGKIDLPDEVLTLFKNRNQQTAQDYLYSHELPEKVKQGLKEIFGKYKIDASQAKSNKEFFEKFLSKSLELQSDVILSLRNDIATKLLSSEIHEDQDTRTHALMWWRAVDIELDRKRLISLAIRVKDQPGVHAMALIERDDKKFSYVDARCSGSRQEKVEVEDTKDPILNQILRTSKGDAEVEIIQDIESKLNKLFKGNDEYNSISVVIVGQQGACDGCHHRIEQAAERWRNKAGLSKRLTVTNVYKGEPHTVLMDKSDKQQILGRGIVHIDQQYFGRANRAKQFTQKLNLNKDPNRPLDTYYAEDY